MLKSVTVINQNGDSLVMDLYKPELSGFNVKSIDGLGPGKAALSQQSFGLFDGGVVTKARYDFRNIVLNLAFVNDNGLIEDVRQKSYRYFPIKKQIRLKFETDNRTTYIDGFVESNEPVIFSKNSETKISVICPFPWFKNDSKDNFDFANDDSLFEFPFSNESLDHKLIEFANVNISNSLKVINYDGDVETGAIFKIIVNNPKATGTVKIINAYNSESFTVSLQKIKQILSLDFSYNDEIIINTENGQREVLFNKQGTYYNVLSAIDINSNWLMLYPGSNRFTYFNSGDPNDINVIVNFNRLYEGV